MLGECEGLVECVHGILIRTQDGLNWEEVSEVYSRHGNGEPTMHPQFLEIVQAVRRVRDKLSAGTPIALLSNSTQLTRGDVLEAVELIDFPIFKLDAGDNATLHEVNRPVAPIELDEIVEYLCRLDAPCIQTVMLNGRLRTCEGPPFDSWLQAIGKIRPRLIQLYSPDSPIVSEDIAPVPPERLAAIARDIRRKMGLDARPF